MSIDLDVLQKELTERVAALEAQRQREAEEFEQLKTKREKEIADDKASRMSKYREAEATRLANEAWQREKWEVEQKAQRDARCLLEMEQEKAAQATRDYEERLRRLEEELAKVEFAEEQRMKALEGRLPVDNDQDEIRDGIHGLEPANSLMSDHLRKILKQSERHY